MALNNDAILSQTSVVHDGRHRGGLLWEQLSEHPFPSIHALLAIITMIIFPGAFLIATIFVWIVYRSYSKRTDTLPFFLPHFAKNKIDKNNPQIGKKGFNKPQGFIFWGTVMGTTHQLWAKFESALRHIMVLGTTGAGKTETLLGIMSNFLAVGGGGIYNDGKGTIKLYYQMFSITRYFGREDDLLCVNFSKENSSTRPDPAAHISHTIAPFSFGSADNNTQQTTSLMPEDSGGSNKVFSEGAIALITAVMPAMCDLRELGLLKISPKVIRKYTNYLDYCKLMRHPLISESSREAMLGFVKTRSGFDPTKSADKQDGEVTKQWGFNQAYFARALQMLSDSFANIYMFDTGEVDYRDVILNDRILVSILPSMSKSTEDMAQLGKMNLFAIRSALSLGLGGEIEGTTEDVLDSNVTSTSRPSICINDEISFYLAKGFMITAAQARGLMTVMLFSSQEFASIKKASEMEAEQMWANTRWKFIMASEGDNETLSRLQQLAGKVWAYVRTGLQSNGTSVFSNYVSKQDINLTQIEKLNIGDLRRLDEGEALTFYQDKMIETRMFYHGVEKENYAAQLRILSCPDPTIAPPRGPYKDILSNENFQLMISVKDWLKNLQAGDHSDEKTMIKPSTNTMVALNMETYLSKSKRELDVLNTAEKGLAYINSHANALRILEAYENRDNTSTLQPMNVGILNNISGSFGNDNFDNEQGIINESALAELESFIDESPKNENEIIGNLIASIDENKAAAFENVFKFLNGDEDGDENPTVSSIKNEIPELNLQKTLGSISRVDDHEDDNNHFPVFDHLDAIDSLIDSQDVLEIGLPDSSKVNSEKSANQLSEYLPDNVIKRISESTARLETILGTSPAHAKHIAQTTIKQVVEAVEYPKTKFKPNKNKLDVIKGILDSHIQKTQK